MATTLGTPVNFALSGTDGLGTDMIEAGGFLLQSIDYSKASDEEQIKSAAGALVSRNFFNPYTKVTLEYTPADDTDIAGAISNTTLPDIGDLVDITACDSIPALVASNWIVVGEPTIRATNGDSKRITVQLEAHAGITAIAT